MKLFSLVTLLSAVILPSGQAEEIHDLYRSAAIQSMGGVSTPTAEGTDALYLNPAGLASNDEFRMQLVNAYAEGSASAQTQLTTYTALLGAVSGLSAFNAIIGTPIFAKAQVAPTFLTGKLGISFLYDVEAYQYTVSQALPTTQVGAQITYGAQVGYGYSKKFGGGGKSRRESKELRIGVAGKFLVRRGGYFYLDPVDYLQYTTNFLPLINSKMGSFAAGFGVDIGVQYIQPMAKNFSWVSGVAARDIGDTMFPSNQAAPIRQNLSLGTSLIYRAGTFAATLGYDLRNITQSLDPRLKNHIGLSLKVPVVTGFVGINQIYVTYGVAVDIWAVKIAAAYYSTELGAAPGTLVDGRYAVNADVRLQF